MEQERKIFIQRTTLDKYRPDRFALQELFKVLGVAYQYDLYGEWTSDQPKEKPQRTRVVFDLEKFRAARDSYFAWQFLAGEKVENPDRPEECLKRIARARLSGNPLVLFVPWGVRPEGQAGNCELRVMDKIVSLQDGLKQRKINAQVLLMPADLYATEINQVDSRLTFEYFSWLEKEAQERNFEVKPWSRIREENWETYRKTALELTESLIISLLPKPVIDKAIEAATKRSGYQIPEDIRNSAFAYLRESLCEAEIIESIYLPIKVSAVSKFKDKGVDKNLPRIYVIPREWQFPWLITGGKYYEE